jgi:hypothetical protein
VSSGWPPAALTCPHTDDLYQPELQYQLFWLVTHVITSNALSIAVITCPSVLPGIWLAETPPLWIAESEPAAIALLAVILATGHAALGLFFRQIRPILNYRLNPVENPEEYKEGYKIQM